MTGEAISAAISGFALGLSLIVVIGAQNAFVLRQGLRRSHVFAVALTCALSDAILIAIGVGGFGLIINAIPWITPVITWAGAAFLIGYGALSFWRAFTATEALEAAANGNSGSLRSTLLTCLALTWFNPHVYLDTVVLLGTVASRFEDRLAFGLGAVVASFVFFFTLGYGARALAPYFARPSAWRTLDIIVGIIMWVIAAKLILS